MRNRIIHGVFKLIELILTGIFCLAGLYMILYYFTYQQIFSIFK